MTRPSSPFSTNAAWSQRLDQVGQSVEAAAAGREVPAVDFDDLGPLPEALRERAAKLLQRLSDTEQVVRQRLDDVDRALRLGAPGQRPRGDQVPAPSYLDQRA